MLECATVLSRTPHTRIQFVVDIPTTARIEGATPIAFRLTDGKLLLFPVMHLGGIKLVRFPVPDGDTPTQEQMVAILGVIRDALLGGAMVYVHCLAGYGRTGTVAWSWLVSQGRTPTEAMETIAKNRAYDRELAAKESPGFLQQQELNRRFVARKEV